MATLLMHLVVNAANTTTRPNEGTSMRATRFSPFRSALASVAAASYFVATGASASVTFSWTGTIQSEAYSSGLIGETVSGTFTVDFTNPESITSTGLVYDIQTNSGCLQFADTACTTDLGPTTLNPVISSWSATGSFATRAQAVVLDPLAGSDSSLFNENASIGGLWARREQGFLNNRISAGVWDQSWIGFDVQGAGILTSATVPDFTINLANASTSFSFFDYTQVGCSSEIFAGCQANPGSFYVRGFLTSLSVVNEIPEPSSAVLAFVAALAGMFWYRRRSEGSGAQRLAM